jgi:glycolate oxidase
VNAPATDPGRRVRAADTAAFVRELGRYIGADAFLTNPEDLRPFACDALTAYTRRPWIAVLPGTVEEVRQVLRLCREYRIPVVARGAGTGLSGGALPVEDGVLLSLTKFDRILEIDPVNRFARVEPGVRNLAISEAAAPHGLYYAPDPSSQIACSIGGNVAENSGGVHCLKYGLTVHNVLQVSVVTMEGELLTFGSLGLDGPGYDLLALIHGSEGLLGVVVEVVVRLLPIPETAKTLLASFASIEAAGDAVAGLIAAGLLPAGLELMDRFSIHATESFVHAGYPLEAEALVLCELDGMAEQVEADTVRARAVFESFGAEKLREARNETERKKFWAGRKAAFPAVGRLAPDYYCMDGTIPRHRLAGVLRQIEEWSREYGVAVANVFHAGDGNLHPLILYDAQKPGELARVEEFGARILELCVAVGGTITGEHGVGVEKIDSMCIQFAPAELRQFHALKAALDPEGLLNPGKAIPTLHRCAEFGRMHVHGGRLNHPELERF